MKDIFFLTTSAAWRKLYHIRTDAYTAQDKSRNNTRHNIVDYLSLAPYAAESGRQQLEEIAAEDKIAACGLALYRASLLLTYKHVINKDYLRAHEECNHAITYLQEGLNLLGVTTETKQNDLTARARCFVNSLASQAELQEARKKNKIASRLFFVLGMHRSGTSALTGMLAQAGFAMPSDLMPATDANPKGYWESVGIMRLNEDFLAGMESHWTSSLPLPTGWSQSINCREWRTSLINIISESFRGAQLPTIKDPRFCTLILGLEPWLESRIIEPSFLLPIRHPLEVCNSLRKAEGIELNKALRLWIKSILLTEEMKRKRESEIIAKEKEAKELQKSRFGVDGDLFKKRQELIKPIQDKIYKALKEMATKGSYAVIFDKSSDLSMLYTNPKFDKSDAILLAMGYKKGNKGTDGKGASESGGGMPKGQMQGGDSEPGKK